MMHEQGFGSEESPDAFTDMRNPTGYCNFLAMVFNKAWD